MKFAKKILMSLLVLSLLACALVFSSSAEESQKSPAYYEYILEYGSCDVYFTDGFEGYDLSTESDYTDKVVDSMKFHGAAAVIEDSGNQLLKIPATADMKFFRWTKEDALPKSVVASFKVKLGDADADNGSTVALNFTMKDYFEDIAVLKFDALNAASATLSYASFDEERIDYSYIVSPNAIALGKWYSVDVVFNTDNGVLDILVTDGTATVASVSVPANESASGIDSFRLTVDNGEKTTETVTYIDDVKLYEGKIIRDVVNSGASLADYVIDMDAYAKDAARTIDEKLAMADLYEKFFFDAQNPYTPDPALEKYEAVQAIKDGARGYINQAHADALIAYTPVIMTKVTCYDKLEYQETVVKPFYDVFPSGEADIDAMPGMSDIFEGEVTYGEKVFEAKTQYDKATSDIEIVKIRSAGFVRQLESGYDPQSKDYIHMITQRNALATLVKDVDPAFMYKKEALGNPASDYATAGDALAAYGALVSKIADIEQTVNNFIPKAAVLAKTEADAVSEQSPYLTVNFAELYADYLEVVELCDDGVIHPLLDSSTYPGLSAYIEQFNVHKLYVEERIAECDAFVSLVNGASNVGLYYTTLEQLDVAAKYLDSDKELSLEKHTGVAEAIALYYQLRQKLATDMQAAANYMGAVAAINLEASYADLSAQVSAAVALRESGAIVGIAGIKEANVKLIEAEKKLTVFESNSATLIKCVDALKKSTDLAERRELIFTAKKVQTLSQDAIAGVTAAKAELASQIEKYDSDVAAANAVFAGVVTDVATVSAAACPSEGLYKLIDVVKALLK